MCGHASQNPDTALEKVYYHYFSTVLILCIHSVFGKFECTLLVKKVLSANLGSCVLLPVLPLNCSMTLNGSFICLLDPFSSLQNVLSELWWGLMSRMSMFSHRGRRNTLLLLYCIHHCTPGSPYMQNNTASNRTWHLFPHEALCENSSLLLSKKLT